MCIRHVCVDVLMLFRLLAVEACLRDLRFGLLVFGYSQNWGESCFVMTAAIGSTTIIGSMSVTGGFPSWRYLFLLTLC